MVGGLTGALAIPGYDLLYLLPIDLSQRGSKSANLAPKILRRPTLTQRMGGHLNVHGKIPATRRW